MVLALLVLKTTDSLWNALAMSADGAWWLQVKEQHSLMTALHVITQLKYVRPLKSH
jgi:hypothetical protein